MMIGSFSSGAPAVPANRTRVVASITWGLFWTLMVLVAMEDNRHDDGTAPWQPVLWEISSVVVATVLFLVQRRFSRGDDALVATP